MPTTINLRFLGQYFDRETGLHYNWMRYYDPQTGRYISSDRIGLAGGLNTYGYVTDNPLGFADPFGLAPSCLWQTGPFTGAGTGPFTCAGSDITTPENFSGVMEGAGNGIAVGTALVSLGGSLVVRSSLAVRELVAEAAANSCGVVPKSLPNITNIGTKISNKQLRHIKGRSEWVARGQGGYFNNIDDAQSVLSATHAGKVDFLGKIGRAHV